MFNESINQYVVVVEPPDDYPVTLEEARLQCKVDADENSPPSHPDDPRLLSLIKSATEELDSTKGWLGRALVEQTLELVLDRFPCGKIVIPYPPLIEVISVKYNDANGDEQTLAGPSGSPPSGGDYRVVGDIEPAYIEPAYGTSWPATRGSAAVRIRFFAGYGTPDDVPNRIKEYMLHQIVEHYEYREISSMGQISRNSAIDWMLENFRIF